MAWPSGSQGRLREAVRCSQLFRSLCQEVASSSLRHVFLKRRQSGDITKSEAPGLVDSLGLCLGRQRSCGDTPILSRLFFWAVPAPPLLPAPSLQVLGRVCLTLLAEGNWPYTCQVYQQEQDAG